MAQYRVLKRSFINNSIAEEGAVVEYEGETSDNLELLDAPADTVAKKPRKASADADALA